MAKNHSIELRRICLDIGMNLLINSVKTNKESLQNYSKEIKKRLDIEFDKIIEDGFVSYFERLIIKEYTNPEYINRINANDLKLSNNEEEKDLIKELEEINEEYERNHVSLLNISTQGQIYRSVIRLLDGWNNNIKIFQDKLTNDEDKKKFYYLILLSSLDLRLGSILEFYCAFPDNKERLFCSPGVIKTLKLSHFDKRFIIAILNEKISEISKDLWNTLPIPGVDPDKYLTYWIELNE